MGLTLLACPPLNAAEPTFDELLARAEAEAAAGHGLAPPGDNVAETALALYKLVPIATPAQLNALTALLDREDLIVRKPEHDTALNKTVTAPDVATAAPPAKVSSVATVADEKTLSPALPTADTNVVAALAPVDGVVHPATPNGHAASLFAHGEAAEERGDISAARRFYAAAAQLRHAGAAGRLGRLLDPAYLKRTTSGGMDGDTALAKRWYDVAAALGESEVMSPRHAISER
jgi:TPR repeat protein